jgi:hypothetical protein
MAAGATGYRSLRASDADREQAIDAIKAAFVLGRLTKDELGMRAGQALAARTYADLAVSTADIPVRLIGTRPPPKPFLAHARKPVNKKVVAWSACAIIVTPALGAAFFTYYGGFLVLFLFAFIAMTVTSQP